MYEELCKRLLSAMQVGVVLYGKNGHIFINSVNELETDTLPDILSDSGIGLNGNIYGGIFQALDTIDLCLKMSKKPTLLESYDSNLQSLGNQIGPDKSRITKTKHGCGGLW